VSITAAYENGQIVAERHQRARTGKIADIIADIWDAQAPMLYRLTVRIDHGIARRSDSPTD
jgi:hypothetical protein